jgi:lipoprotein NlpI
MYSLASDLLSKVTQDDAKGRVSWELQLSRVLFRRASVRLQCSPAAACNTSSLRDAVADLDASLALQPSQPRAYLQKGLALLQLREHSAASEALIAGMQLDASMRPHFDQVSSN